jgi:hypothetical protein
MGASGRAAGIRPDAKAALAGCDTQDDDVLIVIGMAVDS